MREGFELCSIKSLQVLALWAEPNWDPTIVHVMVYNSTDSVTVSGSFLCNADCLISE